MGSWGTAPLQNDGVLDFIGGLAKSHPATRVAKAQAALLAYRSFHARMLAGGNVSVLSDQDRAELLASREETLLANAGAMDGLIELMPQYATSSSWVAFVDDMAKPQSDDGGNEAGAAIAAAWATAAALGKVPRAGQGSPLGAATPGELAELARAARPVLEAIAANELLRATWHAHADEWAAHLHALRDALAG